MNSRVVLSLIAVSLMIISIPLMSDATSADESSATVEGYLKINGVITSNDSVVVTIYYPLSGSSEFGKKSVTGINSEGLFSISGIPDETNASDCLISFALNGYSMSSLPSQVESNYEQRDNNICYHLSSSIGQFHKGITYTLGDNDLHSFSMYSSYGSVKGRVVMDTTAVAGLNGASVVIKNSHDVTVASTVTTNGGYFEIEKCPTGNYEIIVSMNGYVTVNGTVTVNQAETTLLEDARMVKDRGPLNMDLNHILMVLAAIITVAIVAFTAYHTVRSKKK